jgi:hypothetical protein
MMLLIGAPILVMLWTALSFQRYCVTREHSVSFKVKKTGKHGLLLQQIHTLVANRNPMDIETFQHSAQLLNCSSIFIRQLALKNSK